MKINALKIPHSSILIPQLLKIAAASVFAGRAYQHLFWDAPYREFLWDDQLMKPIIELLTPWTWHEYVTNLAVDAIIVNVMIGIGIYFSICAIGCLFYEKMPKWFRWVIWVGVVWLVIIALMYMKEIFYHAGQFFEYTLQFAAPVFLLAFYKNADGKEIVSHRLLLAMKWATALTFACHGLYAIGYYPRPGVFTGMTMLILHCSESFAVNFLTVAGWLDFAIALGIFLPWKWAKWFLLYAAFWGMATSIARVWGNFYVEFPLQSLHEWAYHMVYRLPHGLIPLVIYLILKSQEQKQSSVVGD